MIRYLSHPQVVIDPGKDVQKWSLNDIGARRVQALARSDALYGTTCVISSAETKALETATPLVKALGCRFEIRELMHENDRSATGFLPPDEFETVADQFFANPQTSIRGWETAQAAQRRIVKEVEHSVRLVDQGDVLFVGHGGVGTLLNCHLRQVPISRDYDQGRGGGGCYFEYSLAAPTQVTRWRPMEELSRSKLFQA
jgi:broad specificity phosphatase PhoE